ncbi:DUF6417 family protein [Streptomyces sp. NPDC007905]|uniref:DUF6417 family protein n=1 Tax=Streptomyces sp. NPDC007905 TaxID=3364788 RepID=UPI0036EB8AD8
MSREDLLAALEAVHRIGRTAAHGWVLDAHAVELRSALAGPTRLDLVEWGDREMRAELSALEGRPVRQAVRLSRHGRDVLAYARRRPRPQSDRPVPGPGLRLVELKPSQMSALRTYLGLAGHLHEPPAEGLAEQVNGAVFHREDNRWRLLLTQRQMESAAYGYWLHRVATSAAEANAFGREYGVTYRPGDRERRAAAALPGARRASPHAP